MLFNSYSFLFLFLPVVAAGFFWLGRHNPRWAAGWLALASFVFYAYWDYRYVPLLLGSICFNYWAGLRIDQARGAARGRWLAAAVAIDLAVLGYYKYADFFLGTVNRLGGVDIPLLGVVLPIGISFFTFTQIAFLVDTYRGRVQEYRFVHYALFVTYFPHLIAGPVLHHKDVMPQFADDNNYRLSAANIAIGASIFVIGLAKKELLADNLSPMASPVFQPGAQLHLIEAWVGVLAYTFQLYFDFSGYSDMAIGLSRMLGVKLPLNFDSPYKAVTISDFWRRWHMTLSRFLRDYLYVPLGGNRRGVFNRYRNLMITMLLGGLWHGAGWTFVVWGGLHGIYLVIQHAWSHATGSLAWKSSANWRVASTALTFLAVVLAWVFFRAPDLSTAKNVLTAMAGFQGIALPPTWAAYADWLGLAGIQSAFSGLRVQGLGSAGLPALFAAMAIAWWMPNTQQIFGRFEPCLEKQDPNARPVLAWAPTRRWAIALSVLFVCCVLGMNRVSEFLYFQF